MRVPNGASASSAAFALRVIADFVLEDAGDDLLSSATRLRLLTGRQTAAYVHCSAAMGKRSVRSVDTGSATSDGKRR